MHCSLYMGSLCILLEDLGFSCRARPDEAKTMSYYAVTAVTYDKIFVDVDVIYVIEMFLGSKELMIDRWHKEEKGLYLVQEGIDLDLHDPYSINKVADFVKETINIAGYGTRQ